MMNERLHIDCMEYMDTCKDNYFPLAIADPEYGIGASKQSNKSKFVKQKNGSKTYVHDRGYAHKEWDNKRAGKEYFDELLRVSENQIIWGVNYYDYYFGPGRIIWDKLNDHSDQNDCEIAYNSLNKRQDIVRYLWSGFMQGAVIGGNSREALRQIGDKSKNESKIHPTQKPVILYEWLLSKYAQKGWTIFDSHAGSFSLAIACHNMNFDYVGCELDKDYFDGGDLRFHNETRQQRMFN